MKPAELAVGDQVFVTTGLDPLPPVKWAGGKRELVARIQDILGPVRTYHEPYLGGAAVLLGYIPAQLRMFQSYPRTFGSDILAPLVNVYSWIRDDTDGLVRDLRAIQRRVDEAGTDTVAPDSPRRELYYELRKELNAHMRELTRIQAARFLATNGLGFNGVFRVNRRGEMNVPVGRYDRPDVVREENLRACAIALRVTQIRCMGDEEAVSHVRAGDGVYFDPPFVSQEGTRSFASYAGRWGREDDERAARLFRECAQRGARCVASNSDTPRARELYAGFPLLVVSRRGTVSSGKNRDPVGEILVWNGTMEEAARFAEEDRLAREKAAEEEAVRRRRREERDEKLAARAKRPAVVTRPRRGTAEMFKEGSR